MKYVSDRITFTLVVCAIHMYMYMLRHKEYVYICRLYIIHRHASKPTTHPNFGWGCADNILKPLNIQLEYAGENIPLNRLKIYP